MTDIPLDPDDYKPLSTPEADPWTIDIDDIDMAYGPLFREGVHHEYFKRLRRDDPVHYYEGNPFTGPYWSVTKYKDVLAVDTNHKQFSSEPSIVLIDNLMPDQVVPSFIAMDPPSHDIQRKAVTPAVKPLRLAELDDLIRERTVEVLDGLPIGEPFNWVERVSIELTTRMLATLFDFPFEDRRKLTFWSDVATTPPVQLGLTPEERAAHLIECLETFTKLFQERQFEGNESQDFISLLANNPETRDMDPMTTLGNLLLLIVGGNDTTRNSMSGGVWFCHQNPDQFEKVKANPDLIPSMVSEIIRYQTPLSYMRRTALEDVEIGGKLIKKGEKVAMWYCSANRDEEEIDRPDEFIVDRPNSRHHIAFGFGIHRCMGNRVAEAQLRIIWEEILKRYDRLEVIGKPEYLSHSFVHGIKDMQVVLHPKG
jgi:cytochrome P450